MSVTYNFLDNCEYGADEINKAFSKLTTQGVSLFNYSNGDNPLMSLNEAIQSFCDPGINMYNENACVLSYEDERYKISQGTAIMVDGSMINIEDEPYDITDEVLKIKKEYEGDLWVFFYRDVGKNAIEILIEKTRDNFDSEWAVKIGKINADKTVTDLRVFSQTKLLPCSKNIIQTGTVEIPRMIRDEETVGLNRYLYTIPDIFKGATKVFMNSKLFDIQCVDVVTGYDIDYQYVYNEKISNERQFIAFNRADDGIEVWFYTGEKYINPKVWEALFF